MTVSTVADSFDGSSGSRKGSIEAEAAAAAAAERVDSIMDRISVLQRREEKYYSKALQQHGGTDSGSGSGSSSFFNGVDIVGGRTGGATSCKSGNGSCCSNNKKKKTGGAEEGATTDGSSGSGCGGTGSRRRCEESYYACTGDGVDWDEYCNEPYSVTTHARARIAEWGYEIMDHYQIPREGMATAMYYIDRMIFLRQTSAANSNSSSSTTSITRYEFQLLCVAAVYLAAKLANHSGSKLSLQGLVRTSRSWFSTDDIADAEASILAKLQWLVHPPTAAEFVGLFVDLAVDASVVGEEVRRTIRNDALYLTEQAVLHSSFLHHYPSEIAMAALFNTIPTVFPQHQQPMYHQRAVRPRWNNDGRYSHRQHRLTPLQSVQAKLGLVLVDAHRVAQCRSQLYRIMDHYYFHYNLQCGHLHSQQQMQQQDAAKALERVSSPVSVVVQQPQAEARAAAAASVTKSDDAEASQIGASAPGAVEAGTVEAGSVSSVRQRQQRTSPRRQNHQKSATKKETTSRAAAVDWPVAVDGRGRRC